MSVKNRFGLGCIKRKTNNHFVSKTLSFSSVLFFLAKRINFDLRTRLICFQWKSLDLCIHLTNLLRIFPQLQKDLPFLKRVNQNPKPTTQFDLSLAIRFENCMEATALSSGLRPLPNPNGYRLPRLADPQFDFGFLARLD